MMRVLATSQHEVDFETDCLWGRAVNLGDGDATGDPYELDWPAERLRPEARSASAIFEIDPGHRGRKDVTETERALGAARGDMCPRNHMGSTEGDRRATRV